MFNIKFNEQELNFILQVLGELPTKTNAHVLFTSVLAQKQAQMPEEPQTEVDQIPGTNEADTTTDQEG